MFICIGTVAKRSEEKGMDVLVVSGDRDLLQIVTDKVRVCIPKTKRGTTEYEMYYTKDVQEKYGLLPLQIIELKALMGDSSDNIPGVPGIGEKTATAILQQYENIETAHAHLEEIKPKRAKENLEAHYDMAVMSKKLATIETNAPYEYDWESARAGNVFTKEAYELCQKLELKKLMSKFDLSEIPQEKAPEADGSFTAPGMTDEVAEEDPFRLAPTNSSAAQMAAWDPIRFVNTIPWGNGHISSPNP